jgi:uncharacterized protein
MSTLFVLFFTTFFGLYFGINYLVWLRGCQALAVYPRAQRYFKWAFWLLPISFVAGRVVENWFVNIFSSSLIWIGSFWMAFLAYFLLAILAIDLARLAIYVFQIKWSWLPLDGVGKFRLGLAVTALVALTVLGGFINALWPVVREMDIVIDKPSGTDRQEFRLLMASDIHLGTIVGKARLERLVGMINAAQPDLVLLAGDVVDEDIGPVIAEDMGSSLKKIQPPLGFYAITGNHEYIGGVEPSIKYLSEHGLRVLRDEAVLVADSFYLVGREDLSIDRFGMGGRQDLDQLLTGLNSSLPIIAADHQPEDLASVAADGRIDFQMSGHTHNGQMWPFNYIVKFIFEIPYGYGRIGDAQFYVSNGYGTWGPPIKVGKRPEVLVFNLKFLER